MVRRVIGETGGWGIIKLYFLNSRLMGGQWNWQHLNQRAVTYCLISYQIFRVFQDELEYDFTEMRTNKVRNFNNCSLATPLALLEFSNWTPYLCNIQSVQHVNCNKLILLFETTRCIAELLNSLFTALLTALCFCLPAFLLDGRQRYSHLHQPSGEPAYYWRYHQYLWAWLTQACCHGPPPIFLPLQCFLLCVFF